MPICHEKKFIFYHIPRCGGTSIEQYFELRSVRDYYGVVHSQGQDITLHHLTGHDMLNFGLIDEGVFQSYFKFTIIRDPFERLVSDYYWQKHFDCHNEFHKLSFIAFLDRAEQIVSDGLYFEKKHYDHFRPMIDYCHTDGQTVLDDILLLHNIDDGLERIRDKIGSAHLPHINSSPRGTSSLDNAENRSRVYEIYARDKKLFDSTQELGHAQNRIII